MTSVSIASGTVFYNDCKSLERTLESLKDKVTFMFCIDGRYKHFEDNNETGLSNDGSRELVQSYDRAILIDMPNSYEVQKRQRYLEECAVGHPAMDFLLIIDSDEYVAEYDETEFRARLERISGGKTAYSNYNIFAVMLEVYSGKYDHIVYKIVGDKSHRLQVAITGAMSTVPGCGLSPMKLNIMSATISIERRIPLHLYTIRTPIPQWI